MTDLCLLGLLPSPHQGVGLGGNYCRCSRFLTSTQGIEVSFLFLFPFSFPAINPNLCSLGRSLMAITDTRLSLMSSSKIPSVTSATLRIDKLRKNSKIAECAGELIPLWETKESSRFNLVAPPGRQRHQSGRLSQSAAGKRNSHLRRFIIIDAIEKLWQQQYLQFTPSVIDELIRQRLRRSTLDSADFPDCCCRVLVCMCSPGCLPLKSHWSLTISQITSLTCS